MQRLQLFSIFRTTTRKRGQANQRTSPGYSPGFSWPLLAPPSFSWLFLASPGSPSGSSFFLSSQTDSLSSKGLCIRKGLRYKTPYTQAIIKTVLGLRPFTGYLQTCNTLKLRRNFHETSTKLRRNFDETSTKLPRNFHETSTKLLAAPTGISQIQGNLGIWKVGKFGHLGI